MYNSHFFPSSRVKAASLVDESGSLLGSPALLLAACRQAPLGSRLGEFLCQFEHFSPYKTPYFWIILYHTCWRYNHTFWIILVGVFLELPKGWPFCPMTFDKNNPETLASLDIYEQLFIARCSESLLIVAGADKHWPQARFQGCKFRTVSVDFMCSGGKGS